MQKSTLARYRWPLLIAVVVLVGIALRAPALHTPRVLDDHAQLAMLERTFPSARSPLDLYSFVQDDPDDRARLLATGYLPWWSHPRFSLSMLRPVPSLLTWADHGLFGRNEWAAHAHSLAWWVALVAAIASVLRVSVPGASAGLALLLYAVDECHTLPLCWLAARSALVATAFGFLAVGLHVRWRERGKRGDRIGSVAAAALAVLSGEYALAPLAYVGAWEVFVARDAWRRRIKSVWPMVALVAAFLVIARLSGHRSGGSTEYLDPLAPDPGFVPILAGRAMHLLADLLAGAGGGTPAIPALVGITAFGGLLAASLPRLEAGLRRTLMWLVGGAVLAVLPALGAPASSRVLLAPAVGVAGALAIVGHSSWRDVRDARPKRPWSLALRVPLVLGLAAVHLVLAPLRSASESRGLPRDWTAIEDFAGRMPAPSQELEGARVVPLAASDLTATHYAPFIWRERAGVRIEAWNVLSAAAGSMLLVRSGEDALELRGLDAPLLTPHDTRVVRPLGAALRNHDEIRLPGMTLTVLDSREGIVWSLLARFDRSLDDPGLVVCRLANDGFRRVVLPAAEAAVVVPPQGSPGS